MTGLSSNWKKLQTQSRDDCIPDSKLKRKSLPQFQSSAHYPKVAKTAITQTASEKRNKPNTHIKMGGVQSSATASKPTSGHSPTLAMWADDSIISAEALAEAYNLGVTNNSLMSSSINDKVNHGLSSDVHIGKYIGIDCEMVGVGSGGYKSALARVSVVDFHGRQLYDSYVQPKEPVTEWRTSVSGISRKEMRFARQFDEVQQEICSLLRDRVLIGHDIKHDLDALMLNHPTKDIRDTAKYSAFRRYATGRKPALRVLAREILGIEIQSGSHSSTEDARVAMLLFRKHKSGFDIDHANRYISQRSSSSKAYIKNQNKIKK